jgi:hypothetical protein
VAQLRRLALKGVDQGDHGRYFGLPRPDGKPRPVTDDGALGNSRRVTYLFKTPSRH